MSVKSFSSEAIVLKRVNVGELDRIVTLLTPSLGKLVCVAKGVRRMNSSQGSLLEPGNHISSFFIQTKSLPILTQTRLLDDFEHTKKSLQNMKKLAEILEVIDQLFPEGVEEEQIFAQVVEILKSLNQPNSSFTHIQDELGSIIAQLGYPEMADTQYTSILEYVSAVAERPMHSYDFLTVKSKT